MILNTKKLIVTAVVLFAVVFTATCQVKAEIEKEQKKGNTIFLVVTDGNTGITEAKKIADEAHKKVSTSKVLTMDRTDKKNAALVKDYGIAGAPVPMIIVVASNGVVCGGFANEKATTDNLVQAIPTEKQAVALLAFQEKKPVFVVISKKTMKDTDAVIEECKKAITKLEGKAVYVNIDMDDNSEKSFIELLNPDMNATNTNILVFNSKGQFAQKFVAPVKAAKLAAAAKKVPTSCCPGKKGGC